MVKPIGRLYQSVLGIVGREDVVSDVVGKSLPDDNGIGAIFPEVSLQCEVFLVNAVTAVANGEYPKRRAALTEMPLNMPFRHQVGRAGVGLC